jgi:hypothetical protein
MSGDGNPIEAVRERLDGGKLWYKGDAFDPRSSNRVCVIEACSQVAAWRVSLLLDNVVQEQFPDRGHATLRPAAAFNDHPDTTWADVDLVLDKAARRWDETA